MTAVIGIRTAQRQQLQAQGSRSNWTRALSEGQDLAINSNATQPALSLKMRKTTTMQAAKWKRLWKSWVKYLNRLTSCSQVIIIVLWKKDYIIFKLKQNVVSKAFKNVSSDLGGRLGEVFML